MGSKTVIRVGYPPLFMPSDGLRSLVVTTTGLHSHSFMFWVFFRLLQWVIMVLCGVLKPYIWWSFTLSWNDFSSKLLVLHDPEEICKWALGLQSHSFLFWQCLCVQNFDFGWWLLFWDLLSPKMGSKTVIRVGYPAQLMLPDGPRSLVVTKIGLYSLCSMFWVFFRAPSSAIMVLCRDLKLFIFGSFTLTCSDFSVKILVCDDLGAICKWGFSL